MSQKIEIKAEFNDDGKPVDDRLGVYADDGSIAHFPKKNVFGAKVEKRFVTTTKRIGKHFVILPANFDPSIEIDIHAAPARRTSSPLPVKKED